MTMASEQTGVNLPLAKHYQKLFSTHCHPALFRPMPGYPQDDGESVLTLSPTLQNALHKVSQGDTINLCALLSVALTRIAHRYIQADYPLSLAYSLAQTGFTQTQNFLLTDAGDNLQQTVVEALVATRSKITDCLQLGEARFADIQSILAASPGAPPLPSVQLLVRADETCLATRYANTLQIGYCQTQSDKLTLNADARHYPSSWRDSLLNNLVITLESMVANPREILSKLPTLSTIEQDRVLDFAQGEKRPYTNSLRLEQVLEERAHNTPEALALIAGETRWSYRQLNEQANIIAHNLRRRGVVSGDAIAVMLPRGPEMMAAIYGVLKAGAAYVPVDPSYPANRRDYIIRDSQAKQVLIATGQGEFNPGALEVGDFINETGDMLDLQVDADSHGLAYMIYTSGSTGNPKGVMIEHHSVFNRIEWMQNCFPLQSGDVILQKTPISFDVSVWELFWWMMAGITVSLLQPGGEKEPDVLLETIERDSVTHMHFVPSMLDAFLNTLEAGKSAAQLSSLKVVFTSGEALTLHQSSRFFTIVTPQNSARLVNLYGPTEATVDVTYYECQPEETRGSIPIGRPIQNTDIYILDTDSQPVQMGVAGELCIAGVNLARGYLNRPELTAEKFCTLPAPLNCRVYRTGDLVRWLPDGMIEYLGRIDHQVKIRGYRIELGEIENTVLSAPGVKDARVVALAREDGSKYLTAYILPTVGYDEQQVRRKLLAVLPEFMVPPWFIILDAFPLTPNGKLDRALLPNPLKYAVNQTTVLPQSADEKLLAAIWCEVLNLEKISIHDNFFSLGGDSITSLGVISRARKAGMVIGFQTIFRYPTIASLLPHIEKVTGGEESSWQPFSLLRAEDKEQLPDGLEDAYPMSLLQAGLIFQSELQKGASWYHDIQVYSLFSQFDEVAFTLALHRIVREHPILRTSYHLQAFSEFVQFVHKEIPLPLWIHDWRELDSDSQSTRLEQFLDEESHYQFDWTQPGLIRVHIALKKNDNFDYILSFHDSALDGWSINLFHTRLLTYYHQYQRKDAIIDVPFTDNFLRKYIAMEQETRRSTITRDFWRQQLADYEPIPLPRLRVKQGDIPQIAYHDIHISTKLSNQLRALAISLNVPVKNVLMAAHLRVLGLICNSQTVITGYEHSGRPEEEGVEQAIGLFLNSLPFRLELDTQESWSGLIGRVHQLEANMLPHRRYPMADMKSMLNVTETLFEAVFNFTHFHMLKALEKIPGMQELDVRVRAETEFPLRAEFSQNAYTDQIQLSLHYHTNEFDVAHIARIGHYYHAALNSMVTTPQISYLNTDLLSLDEHQQLQVIGQGPCRPLQICSAPEQIATHAQLTPEKIVLQDVETTLNAATLEVKVTALASALDSTVPPQVVVAVALPRSVRWITAMVGIMRAGRVYMPLDLDNPDARLQELLIEGQVSAIIGDVSSLRRLEELAQEVQHSVICIDFATVTVMSPLTLPSMPVMNDLAYVLFTSGSTGKPKGALLEHSGMMNHMMAKRDDLQITADDVLAQTAPVTFDISIWQALTGLVVNARTVVYSKEQQLDPAQFCQQLMTDGVTLLEIVPSYFAVLLDYLEQSPRSLGALRMLIQTGEALKNEQVARWFELYPNITLVNAYGPTEASDDITHHIFTAPPADAIVPIGRPVQNMWIHILDEQDNLVPFGTSGEICVTGVGVGRGYINTAEKTQLAFDFNHPLAAWSNGRLYRTGDRGRWRTDGNLVYEGRKDEQVKIRGMRIEIGEIENTLMTASGVHNAAVVLDTRDSSDRLVGFVQGSDDTDAIMRHISQILPDFMLPQALIHCHQIPLNAAGKVDKKQLRSLASCLVQTQITQLKPLETESERTLAQFWSQILKVPFESIGRDSDFFHLGGHSLLAMSCAIHSDGRFTLADIFTHRTLRRLAELKPTSGIRPVLQTITAANEGLPLLCFTYAGGNAINFRSVADAMTQYQPLQVFAVEAPGNDLSQQDTPISLQELVTRCCIELKQKGIDRVIVWGHCSGVGGVTLFMQMAQQYDINIEAVILSGKLLRPEEVLQKQIDETRAMSDDQIVNWLRDSTGLDLDRDLPSEAITRMAAAYRNDAIEGNLALTQLWKATSTLTSLRVLCLLAEDDPLTKDWLELANNWSCLAEELIVKVLPKGGHYFIKSEPEAVAQLLLEQLPILRGLEKLNN
ncbi:MULTISPECIES: non-ribosomal peptide synthetase [Xenorhabdus]|uniref:Amino acid adenylation n=1 Tax=Xenorhabdus ehlersii TaxID=290111 RepID=A0A2D0IKB7_9GAMM|nr:MULTISPECIES: non-ribosomal peptide synthetase [Xenorhabdus]MBC8951227.1 Amino acid adenylation [Xenorhabdus sp. TS4]PHM22208.1 Amino acid adenylation [Xenorhabdus ehlersii]RKE93046.1 amino acid adenylation domain-containing protein [Xenorhabdus ehlersii]